MTATQPERLHMDYPHWDLEAASRIRGEPPANPGELGGLLEDLTAAGVQPPAGSLRALRLSAEVHDHFDQRRQVADVLPDDLDTLTGPQLVEQVRSVLLDHFLATRLRDDLRDPLTRRAVAALRADYPGSSPSWPSCSARSPRRCTPPPRRASGRP